MAGDGDDVLLLGDDSPSTSVHPPQPRKIRLQIAAIALIAGVAAGVAWRRSFAAPAYESFILGEIISETSQSSADWLLVVKPDDWLDPQVCIQVGVDDVQMDGAQVKNLFWPHRYTDVNWKDCSQDATTRVDCEARLIEKYVGDYFDKVFADTQAAAAGVPAVTDYEWMPYDNPREQQRWKDRVTQSLQEKSKDLGRVIMGEKHAPLEWLPEDALINKVTTPVADLTTIFPDGLHKDCNQVGAKCTTNGWVCDAMFNQRPISASSDDDCAPNYNSWQTVRTYFTTVIPKVITSNDPLLLSYEDDYKNAHPGWTTTDAYMQPGEYDLTSDKLAACKHLLQPLPLKNEDWISATVTALDVRECIASDGQKPKSPYSRAWVRNCLPGRVETNIVSGPRVATWGTTLDGHRVVGWPGFVLEFISEYSIAESDCVKNYDLESRGHCPTTCEDGTSLAGHLRSLPALYDYKVIHKRDVVGSDRYFELEEDQREFARWVIWNSGPLVGLVFRTKELVECTRDDAQVIYSQNGCAPFPSSLGGGPGDALDVMASVTVYGWGEVAGSKYWSFVSGFQAQGRMMDCGVKMFVVPVIKDTAGVSLSFYNKALSAFTAESVCVKGAGFCTQAGAGYTATEDCDGDGVLDHWCYLADLAGSYEAFISSGNACAVQEKSCRRSVLPGRTFGCQRPLGWCMNGEKYERNVDCDQDGHFDHVCEKFGHAGFISSSQDCIDTWEEGTAGRPCDRSTTNADAFIPYKLVHDAGDCVSHGNGSQCFKSHAEWPKTNYKPLANCKFHIEATNHQYPKKGSADCDGTAEVENQLLLEVLYEDNERPVYDLTGTFYGDKFALNTVQISPTPLGRPEACVERKTCVDWRPLAENINMVYDKQKVEFSSDGSVEKEGWLVCLRERSKIPKLYTATCSEIGDDVWAKLNDVRKKTTYVSVECDMKKCNKAKVRAVLLQSDRFFRTTNLCDAGWQVAQGDKFDVEFTESATFPTNGEIISPTFRVLLA